MVVHTYMNSIYVQSTRDRERAVLADGTPGEDLVAALADPDCQCILSRTDGKALTAGELAERCDVPQSTLYRKLDLLTRTDLLAERVRVARDGKHASEYVSDVDRVVLRFCDDCQVDVDVEHAPPGATLD